MYASADLTVKDDGNGAYLDGGELVADEINASRYVYADRVSAGPYMIKSLDTGALTATLEINPNYAGNFEGQKPSIQTVVIVKAEDDTMMDAFKTGEINFLSQLSEGDQINTALDMAETGEFDYCHYTRNGYGKIMFQCDGGPTQFAAVRQAVAYLLDREEFATTFTGGYGGIVDGAYYAGSWMYKEAAANGMLLNAYDTSADTAIAVLEADGWIYNKDGEAYTEGVRYKKIPAEYADENDINYKSIDGAYVTTKVGDDYYMPLVLNWYGTTDNPFSDLLVTDFEQGANIAAAGIVIQKTTGDFSPMLDEFYQQAVYGFYSGTPMYSCFNYATGFTSAAYDYSYNWSIDPSFYENNSIAYLKDEADIYWLS